MIGGIIFVIRNVQRWRDALKDHGPRKTVCNRFIGWNRLGVLNTIFAANVGRLDGLMIDVTNLDAHRTATGLTKRGVRANDPPTHRAHQKRPEFQAASRLRRQRPTTHHAAQREGSLGHFDWCPTKDEHGNSNLWTVVVQLS